MVLHYNESINILGIELTPKNIDQVICIDSYVPENGGHWKILWHDLRQQLRFGISLEDKCTQMVSEKPMQLGPGLRLIGWVSGHSYSTNANDDTVPGAETYNWCFLIPIKLDNLHNVTVFLLLPPETKAVTNTPPTQLLESTRLGEVGEYINQLNTSKYEVLKTKRADINHFKSYNKLKPLILPLVIIIIIVFSSLRVYLDLKLDWL
ncbi:unnamed protein product [Heterobilharzia americana]|nr:unnamed protein product [Heterobilharzia americana]